MALSLQSPSPPRLLPLSHVCVTRVCRFEALAPPFFRCFLSSPKRPLHQRDQKSPSHLAPRTSLHLTYCSSGSISHIHSHTRTHHATHTPHSSSPTHTHPPTRTPTAPAQNHPGEGCGCFVLFAAGWSCSRPSATISKQRRRPGTPINAP